MINLIRVLEDRSLLISSKTAGVTGENNAEILRFIFPEKISGKNTSELTKTLKFYNLTMEEPRSITLTNDEVNVTDSMTNDTSSTIWLELSTDNFLWMSESYVLIFVPYPTFVANPGGGGTGPTGDIPTRLSQLYNDMGFITAALLPTKTSQLQNDSGYITSASIPEIPTKTSDLTNDSGYITEEDIPEIPTVPTSLSQLYNDMGFITNIPEIPTKTSDLTNDSGYITSNDIPEGFSGNYDDLQNKPTIPTVPTDISAFNNDSGYITESYHDVTKQDVVSIVTLDNPTAITLTDNTEYSLSEVSALVLSVTANVECHIFLTTSSTGTPSFSFTGTSGYAGDSTDTISNSEIWEFSVKNGYVIGKKWGAANA